MKLTTKRIMNRVIEILTKDGGSWRTGAMRGYKMRPGTGIDYDTETFCTVGAIFEAISLETGVGFEEVMSQARDSWTSADTNTVTGWNDDFDQGSGYKPPKKLLRVLRKVANS